MTKSTTQYVCTECGWSGAKWFGRCPQCGEWGTIEEFHEARISGISKAGASGRREPRLDATQSATPITEVGSDQVNRVATGFEEFDRVLGGGIVPGSVVLLAGEPGIGKSTLLLESAGRIASQEGQTVLYVSGEESQAQIRMRATRVDAVQQRLLLASTTDLSTVLALIEQEKPTLAIVDSAQTISSADVDGITGGSSQVREVASALIDAAKTLNIPTFLVGHVTKDGSIAGPRTLEHLVDVVCQFEGDSQTALRMLRAAKNRFGPTDEVGCFDMSGDGIEEVRNPAGLFLSPDEHAVEGTCITFTVDGHRSLPIEVQALVTNSVLPAPRRATNGVDTNRLAMLVAVLHRHGRIPLLSNDLYVSTIAGATAREPACDLAVVAALASAATHHPIPRTVCAIGEISLTGQVRPVPRLQQRIDEAARLGFATVVVAAQRRGARTLNARSMKVLEVSTIKEALNALGISRQ
ncbi:MAG: DNA repair protein RadA [Bifidobacterium sp.]|uniref:DNA repair protein RadA n=1 Tax=Bifidobacterium fermentum TaxID=3059035 RepID=A0AB39UJT4_9BIFI